MRMIQRMPTAHPSLPVVGAERLPPPRYKRPNLRAGYVRAPPPTQKRGMQNLAGGADHV